MGICRYCGKDAGWFKDEHTECKEKHEQALAELTALLRYCFRSKTDFYLKTTELDRAAAEGYVTRKERSDIYVQALDSAMNEFLDGEHIDEEEKKIVARFIQFTGLPVKVLNRNHAIDHMLQAEVLEDVMAGRKPEPKITIDGDFPFLLGKRENMVWLFRGISLYEQKTKREYKGRSSGFSFRLARGIHYRIGAFKGVPIETTFMQRVGTGSVCLTDKNFHFHCPEKSLKLPYSKIITVESHANGITLQKDGVRAKPIFFEGLDSWFCHNIIANLKS